MLIRLPPSDWRQYHAKPSARRHWARPGAPAAVADGMSLAGSLWQCTRSTDQSQFVITFYPGGGVGGGELENGEVSPYIFDASRTRPGEWPV